MKTRSSDTKSAPLGRPGEAATATQPTLAAIVREQRGVAWSRARSLCTEGRVTIDGERCLDPAMRVDPASSVAVDERGPKLRSQALARDAIVFFDRDLAVINKPAGMLSVADAPGNKDTLADHARTMLRRLDGRDDRLGVVHRLDRDTSGLIVFARTATAQRLLAERFRSHDIYRSYHAIAHGTVVAGRVETSLVADRGDGLRGSHGRFRRETTPPPDNARRSVTHIQPIGQLAGATLLECRLETGRQHQIRIHLAELGHPLVGERVYIRDYAGPPLESSRPMLHARTLGFDHPRTGARMTFVREPPADFQAMVAALRLL